MDLIGRRVFDTLGALAAGRTVEASRTLGSLRRGLGYTHSPLDQIRELCASIRCSEVDDIDLRSCTTPGSVAVPVALVLGDWRDVRAQAVLTAVVAGYEAMICFGEAIDGANQLRRGVWPSYVGAVVAAAATAAAVLDLDRHRTAHALAIAATRSVGGAGRIDSGMTSRWLTYGCAAADGVLAALAAEVGFAGDLAALDTVLLKATGLEFQTQFAGGNLAVPLVGRVDVKPFCTARQVLSAIRAARLAWTALGGVDVERIEVGVPTAYRAMIDVPDPSGRLPSMVSAQFQIAAALTNEDLLYDVARREVVLDGATLALAQTIRVVDDRDLSPLYPARWPARILMRAVDGRVVVREVGRSEGDGARQSDWDELAEKYSRLGVWGGSLERIWEQCRRFGTDKTTSARTLLGLAS